MPDNQKIISDLIIQFAESGGLSNSDFVEIIELCNLYLQLKPLGEFGKENGITYQGLLKSKRFQIVTVLNKKFVVDNF
jgi:hypothetical protein